MASYAELSTIREELMFNALLNKVRVAATIKATAVINLGTAGATVLEWAKQAVANQVQAGDSLINYVIADNAELTISQILGASDTAIYSNVSAAVDAIYGA